MTPDRRNRNTSRAHFTRRSTDHALDFGDLPTVPMDLYPQFEVEKVPVPETRELHGVTFDEVVDAVAAVEQKGRA